MRAFLAAAYFALLSVTAQASGADDLKAANEAAQKGQVEEAIRLFSQALSAGDLSPADQFAARKTRGSEYTSASLIADAFERLDQARSMRQKAIEDFTAALQIRSDEPALFTARAQAYDLNGQYDLAVADFGAALKLKTSPLVLVQRANSQIAKGDYDSAVTDFDAALGLLEKSKDTGIDAVDIYSERGYAQFTAGRYSMAAADIAKALELGAPARKDDVLWMPYQMAWLHIARARAGENDAEELARDAAKINVKQWPGTLVAYFLGQTKLDELAGTSSHGSMGHARECGVSFFAGEQALGKKDNAAAVPLFTRARAACNIHSVYYLVSGIELKRLGK